MRGAQTGGDPFSQPDLGLRKDPWALLTLGRYWNRLRPVPGGPERLSEPFGDFMESHGVRDPFIKNYLSMFCFLLQGLPAYGAPTGFPTAPHASRHRGLVGCAR